jgi:hypothetical protein
LDNTSQAALRIFRGTNTTGPKFVAFLRGNATTEESARIGVDGLNSFFQLHGGNFGIGTDAPSTKLDVQGPIRTSSNANLPASVTSSPVWAGNFGTPDIGKMYIGDGTGWKFHFSRRTGGVDTDVITILDNGRVGIGTSSPTTRFQVSGGSASITTTTGSAGLFINSPTGANKSFVDFMINDIKRSNIFHDGSLDALIINNVNTNTLINGTGGNVGIGGINANAKLQVAGGDTYMSTIGSGVILKSPNGSCFRLTVDNTGAIISTPITCP